MLVIPVSDSGKLSQQTSSMSIDQVIEAIKSLFSKIKDLFSSASIAIDLGSSGACDCG